MEHVKTMKSFANYSNYILKNNGIFYASFGPIWFGPSGDHIFWGKERIYDHLLLTKKDYEKNIKNILYNKDLDSCDALFMFKTNLFSYLSVKEYLKILLNAEFKKRYLFAKISVKAINLLKNKPKIDKMLDKKRVPKFDRYCSGIYLWLEKT